MQFPIKIVVLCMLLVEQHMGFKSVAVGDETENGIIIKLPYGRLRGKDNGYYYSYESIPYAEPPIGNLRFANPQEYTRNWTTEFDATRSPIDCMQWNQFTPGNDKLVGQEDCLMVNIYKPKVRNDGGLPILVFIHGGAFMFGSTMSDDHRPFMRNGRSGFIVVKFSYRLGPLGFLSTEDNVITGNYGLKDQRLALSWIKRHIGYFGGDPHKMLIMGFSAGGASVHYQLLKKDFGEYARAAVSFSGTAFCPWALLRNSRSRAFELGRILNSFPLESSHALKNYLLEQKAEDIVRGVRNFLVFGYNPFTTFGPVVEASTVGDDAFLTKTPEEIIMSGNFSRVPWLVTYAAQDGGYNAAELLRKSPRREELIEEFNDRWYDLAPYNLFYVDRLKSVEEIDDYSMALRRLYIGEREFSVDVYDDLQRMYTDVLFKNGVEKAVRLHREFGNSSVYAYVYDNPSDENLGTLLSGRNDIKFGSVHGDDFTLIFPSISRKKQPRQDERIISGKLVKMLEDFVENNELTYGDCKFVDNVGQEKLALMVVSQQSCENKMLTNFSYNP